MMRPIKVLIVEDSEDDTTLLLRELQRGGFSPVYERVDTSAAMRSALDRQAWEIVISDHNMPQFSSIAALAILKEKQLDIPFIIVSGVLGEDAAVTAMKSGAQDYIMKGKLSRLVPAVERELREAENRRAQKRAEAALEQERNLLYTVINSLPQGIYAKDAQHRFILSNGRNALNLKFNQPTDVMGKSDADIFPPEYAQQLADEEKAILSGAKPSVESITLERAPDSGTIKRYLQITKLPLRDQSGKVVGIVGINIDLTELKQAEEELRKAKDAAEANDRAQSQFVVQVSHELRTPLTSMKFEIGNLLKGIIGPLPEPVRKYLEMMNADCARLTRTVNDILDMNRIESKTIQLQQARIPISRLLRRSVEVLRTQVEAKSLTMDIEKVEAHCFVECDPQKIERVIFNIVMNAVNFTPAGGRIEIALTVNEAEQRVIIRVRDTGIGIPLEYLHRVTEKYFMAGKHVTGTGLGLSIAKEIVDLHKGRLEILSPPPHRAGGTQVSVMLPVAQAPMILIADDNSRVRDLLSQQLDFYGYRVIPCQNGEEVLRQVADAKPDLVILDLYMPDLTGDQIILRMKSVPEWRHIPLIAITGAVPDRSKHEVLSGFGIETFSKPWSMEDLMDRIETAFIAQHALIIRTT
jgi:PAS domain S-box-containing protein